MSKKPTVKQLQAVCLREYPDSKLVTVQEAMQWPYQLPSFESERRYYYDQEINAGATPEESRDYARSMMQGRPQEYQRSVLSSLVCALGDAYTHKENLQFYLCGLQPDGTYRHRGCRYGIEGHEYISGFGST